eukprot:5928192-Alexandrium_andersonii.AAC.1
MSFARAPAFALALVGGQEGARLGRVGLEVLVVDMEAAAPAETAPEALATSLGSALTLALA